MLALTLKFSVDLHLYSFLLYGISLLFLNITQLAAADSAYLNWRKPIEFMSHSNEYSGCPPSLGNLLTPVS